MRVQVQLRAENLGNIAPGWWRGCKSSPYAVLSSPAGGADASATGDVELGRTRVLGNTLNPEWMAIFVVEHDEDTAWTPLKITIYDGRNHMDDSEVSKENDELRQIPVNLTSRSRLWSNGPMMGEVNVEAGEILGLAGQELKVRLNQGGYLYVHVTQSIDENILSPVTGNFHCHIRGLDLENIEKGWLGLGAIDPFFVLAKKYNDPESGIFRWVTVYRSGHIPNIINPYWRPFEIGMEELCHGDLGRELKITVYDYESDGKHRWLGEVETDVERLQKHVARRGNADRESALSIKDKYQDEIGLIVVLRAEIL